MPVTYPIGWQEWVMGFIIAKNHFVDVHEMVYRLMAVWSTSAYNIRYLSIEVGFMHSSLST
ncbi:MAG: hypothetical protein KBC44_03300, partial [Candidatus Pacebacteria bacterium]|nr:hypothetical protein [Candidatus Paceibacterota bacterium]